MKMWVDKYSAHLDLKCPICDEELEGEWTESQGDINETIRVSPCEYCMGEKDERIKELEDDYSELDEKVSKLEVKLDVLEAKAEGKD